MKNEAKFHETISILVNAYLSNQLAHNDCAACAVGNIIAAKLGCNVLDAGSWSSGRWERNMCEISPIWDDVFITRNNDVQDIYPEKYKGFRKKQIDASGYTLEQLASIEKAFETCEKPSIDEWDLLSINDEWMFNGLMAVVEVLAEIHEIDLTVKESAKLLFVK